MNILDRKKLNQRVGALAFGRLGLDMEIYRTIVASMDEKSEGHLTRCTDENAQLILLALDRMAAGGKGATTVVVKNPGQQKFIARLMDYLGWSWKDTARFCKHQTGKRSTKACNAGEMTKIIIGMIRIIDDRIEKHILLLTPKEFADYQHHTRLHRTQNSEPETRNSQPEAPCRSSMAS